MSTILFATPSNMVIVSNWNGLMSSWLALAFYMTCSFIVMESPLKYEYCRALVFCLLLLTVISMHVGCLFLPIPYKVGWDKTRQGKARHRIKSAWQYKEDVCWSWEILYMKAWNCTVYVMCFRMILANGHFAIKFVSITPCKKNSWQSQYNIHKIINLYLIWQGGFFSQFFVDHQVTTR